MKIFKRIICAVLVLATVFAACIAFSACGKKDTRGNLVATYKGGEIYESDLSDWQLYFLQENIDEIISAGAGLATSAEITAAMDKKRNEILDKATDYVIQIKLAKAYIKDNGIADISDSSISAYAENVKSKIEEEYASKGGYEYWKSTVCGGVSDNFIVQCAEAEMVLNYMEQCAMALSPVTEDMVVEYWRLNRDKYVVAPYYKFDVIIVPLAENSRGGEDDWDAAKAEAQGYIDRIKAGESFEDVKADAISKSKDPSISKFYSVPDTVLPSEADGFVDKEARLNEIAATIEVLKEENDTNFVEYADPKGDADEYDLWYVYCNLINQLYSKHYAATLEVGEVNDEPFLFVGGYEIIQVIESNHDVTFLDPLTNDNVYSEIYQLIYNELWSKGSGSSVDAFIDKLYKDYEAKVTYRYSAN